MVPAQPIMSFLSRLRPEGLEMDCFLYTREALKKRFFSASAPQNDTSSVCFADTFRPGPPEKSSADFLGWFNKGAFRSKF